MAISAAKNFKVSISYPPLASAKGSPFLSQNRQFQWTNTQNVIYPVIPASAATLLSQNSYQVFWDDAIAEKLSYQQWLSRLIKQKPNLIAIETKTPVIKKHWQIINQLKNKLPRTSIVLLGDHVTALPQESFKYSKVDFILTGGDYDFMLLNLANHLTKNQKLEPGFYTKNSNTGKFVLHRNLDKLPIIDRQLTQWQLYAYNNTNYKYKPGAYIMSARDCWWGRCTFCSWPATLYPTFRTFSIHHTIAEIKNLIQLGVKEVFDDSGTLPIGSWLNNLCHQLIKQKLNKEIKISCNMRFGALNQPQYQLMAKAGFRFLLYGLESTNQATIDKLNKNIKVKLIKKELSWAKNAGLEPHITVMIGYPWENLFDATNTLDFSRQLFKEGLVNSLQATIVIPYPGTPLFDYCQKNHLLLSQNWNDYDMRQPIIKSPLSFQQQQRLINSFFKSALDPHFLIRQVLAIRSFDDLKHLSTYAIKFLQKLRDFS